MNQQKLTALGMQMFALSYSKAAEILSPKSVGALLVPSWQRLVSTGCLLQGLVGSRYSCRPYLDLGNF